LAVLADVAVTVFLAAARFAAVVPVAFATAISVPSLRDFHSGLTPASETRGSAPWTCFRGA
jgi:hypothetical protein